MGALRKKVNGRHKHCTMMKAVFLFIWCQGDIGFTCY